MATPKTLCYYDPKLCYSPKLYVKEGEVYRLQQAIRWVAEIHLDDIVFDLDAKVVVDSFNNPSRDLSYFCFTVEDYIFSFQKNCQNLVLSFLGGRSMLLIIN